MQVLTCIKCDNNYYIFASIALDLTFSNRFVFRILKTFLLAKIHIRKYIYVWYGELTAYDLND